MTRWKALFALPAATLIFAAQLIGVPATQASTATCPSADTPELFDGMLNAYSVNIYGASARIEYNDPNLCDNSYADSTGVSAAWAMTSSRTINNSNVSMYAQVGYWDLGGLRPGSTQGVYQFAQYTLQCRNTGDCGTASFATVLDPQDPTGTWTYSVREQSNDGLLHFYINGSQFAVSGYSPSGIGPDAPSWQPA